ncbi:MAG: ATP-dependent DNA helicase RecG [Firmicutes bacterium]|nr:ATP-dependent DNA helicase RecG [Bacillota bacterium]
MSTDVNALNPTDRVSSIKGIGPQKEKSFNDAGINTLEDLVYVFPRSYEDRRTLSDISDMKVGSEVLISGKVVSKRSNMFSRSAPLSLLVQDDSGVCEVVFFNGKFLDKLFDIGTYYTFFGKASKNFDRNQLIHPQFAKTGSKDDVRGIVPVYPSIPGVSQKEIRRIETELKPLYESIEDFIPKSLQENINLASLQYSLENLHFPTDGKKVLSAKYRMVFSELLTLETGLMYMRKGESALKEAVALSCEMGDRFASELSFELTEGQKLAWEDIKNDLESRKKMNRLLQGDVGSGKTVIAEMAMISAASEGYQSVIMAPTELLAKQHLESFKKDFDGYGYRPEILISNMEKKEKKRVVDDLKSGEIKILIATHAVLQENVIFKNLGLVITDEQHRFGVNQRKNLSSKGEAVNVLVMTATPIPRTLAVILYGDLDVSQIRTMPKGRVPIKTGMVNSEDRDRVYAKVREELEKGRQAYVVAPLIGDSERIDANSAESLYKELAKEFGEYSVALVHGSMKQEEKDERMEAFAKGDINILVSTVVIEVGINVPNATVMVIENAERFGLAQLHQLRGRVGRGSDESFCFLITDAENEVAVKRGEIMCQTTDGFEIAEEDLKIRGPGEIFGTRQHGLPQMIFADLSRHGDVLEKALESAKRLIEDDPELKDPDNVALKRRVKSMFGEEIALAL